MIPDLRQMIHHRLQYNQGRSRPGSTDRQRRWIQKATHTDKELIKGISRRSNYERSRYLLAVHKHVVLGGGGIVQCHHHLNILGSKLDQAVSIRITWIWLLPLTLAFWNFQPRRRLNGNRFCHSGPGRATALLLCQHSILPQVSHHEPVMLLESVWYGKRWVTENFPKSPLYWPHMYFVAFSP